MGGAQSTPTPQARLCDNYVMQRVNKDEFQSGMRALGFNPHDIADYLDILREKIAASSNKEAKDIELRIEPYKGSRVHDRITSFVLYPVENDEDSGISCGDAIGEIYGPIDDEATMRGIATRAAAASDLLEMLHIARGYVSTAVGKLTCAEIDLSKIDAAIAKAEATRS